MPASASTFNLRSALRSLCWIVGAVLLLGRSIEASKLASSWREISGLLQGNRWKEAELSATKFLSRNPGDAGVLMLRCRAFWQSGNTAKAAADLVAAKEHGWPAERCEIERCLLLASAGRFGEAEPRLKVLFDRRLIQDPALPAALAKGYAAEYRFTEALACADAWIRLSPQDPTAFAARAELRDHFRSGQNDALKDYLKAIELAPADLSVVRCAAELAKRTHDWSVVRNCADRLLAANSSDPEGVQLLAEIAAEEGRNDDAKRLWTQLAELKPDHAPALVGLGNANLIEGMSDAAIGLLRRAAELDPLDPSALHLLGAALRRTGRASQAAEVESRLVQLKKATEQCDAIQERLFENPYDAEAMKQAIAALRSLGKNAPAEAWERRLAVVERRPSARAAGQ